MSGRGTAKLVACAALFTSLSACSLLLDDIELTCKDSVNDCAALNQKNGLDDGDCEIYQCRADGRGCEKRARDLDGDGVPDEKTCANELPGTFDCDDGDDAAVPGSEEICDGKDNNCDGWIDEDVLEGNLAALRTPVSVSSVQALDFSDALPDRLLVAVTGNSEGHTRMGLHSFSQTEATSTQFQTESVTCLKGELMSKCSLREVVLAAMPDALLALGINVQGCAPGQVRFASAGLSATSLSWNGDNSPSSNLKNGVLSDPDCPIAPQGVWAPSLAILPGRAKGTGQALGLWRSGRGTAASELFGIGLRIDPGSGAEPRVAASSEPRAFSLSGGAQGFDPARIKPWRDGFFAAYDIEDGLELAFVSGLGAGASVAFEAAARVRIAEPGARQPALALAYAPDSTTPEGLALAWRAPVGDGWTIYFSPISLRPGPTLAFQEVPDAFPVVSASPVTEGPAVVYVPSGFRADVPEGQRGGWWVVWTEKAGSRHKLMGARVQRSGETTLEAPFILVEGAVLEHSFAYATADLAPGYGFVANDGTQQLNIGSLTCRP